MINLVNKHKYFYSIKKKSSNQNFKEKEWQNSWLQEYDTIMVALFVTTLQHKSAWSYCVAQFNDTNFMFLTCLRLELNGRHNS